MANINDVLDERGRSYGPFNNSARVAQELKACLINYEFKLAADQCEALHMICSKIARIVNGDPNLIDSWIDIAGYATLVANRLEKANGVK